MSKRSVVSLSLAMALLGAVVGVVSVIGFDREASVKAVEYFKEGEKPAPSTAMPLPAPVQPAAFFGALPTFSDLAKKVSSSVVNISTTKNARRRGVPGFNRRGPRDPFFDDFFEHFFNGPQMDAPQKSLGSGFLINSEGYIITNNHVVDGADEIKVVVDGKQKYDGKVVGSDPKTDLAVIKISAPNLPSVTLGDSDQIQVGDWVMAVGNPFGLDHTVTAGIVSAKGRVIGAGPYDDFIQTDASINPGNSGGPLFNLKGEVIGVNTAIVAAGQGIGFAIPINMAKDLIPQLISKGKVTRAWLGVGIQEITPELAKSFKLPDEKGALISNVFANSPAEKSGLKSGDVVRSFEGKPINESRDLPTMVAREPVNKTVTLTALRDGKEMTFQVLLGEMEKGEEVAEQTTKTSSAELGLTCRDVTPEEAADLSLAQENKGVMIVNVESGSQAEISGVQRGDVLLSVNGTKLNGVADYVTAAKKIKPGEIVRLYIKRDDATVFLAFTK
ncbi:MAG TPA: DegQ family serine endoprotease [bacterium]|nr:DegQ family serine endoprotease [bacterium]